MDSLINTLLVFWFVIPVLIVFSVVWVTITDYIKYKRSEKKQEEIPQEIKGGDVFIDKEWEDTMVEIVKVNKNRTSVKYKFLMIDGQRKNESGIYETKISYIRTHYYKIDF